MIEEKFFTGAISKAYAKARPSISVEAKNKVIEFMAEKLKAPYETGVDVGCGTGQSTVLFLPHFTKFFGIDSSETQIQEAKVNFPMENLKFSVGDGHKLPFDSNSVSLITSIVAVHWLDVPKFFAECDRVLKPSGVIALIAYPIIPTLHYAPLPECDEKLNKLTNMFQKTLVDEGLVDPKVYNMLNHYSNFELSYKDKVVIKDDPSIYSVNDTTVENVIEYYSSWSPYRELKRRKPNCTTLEDIEKEMLSILPNSNKDTVLQITFPWFIVMCRKPEQTSMAATEYYVGNVSKIYAEVRPTIAPEAKDAIMSFLKEKLSPPFDNAADLACGTGLSTVLLKSDFKNLYGIDTSETQIEQAKITYPFPNVHFQVGDVHKVSSLESGSMSLVLCIQAAHWMRLTEFFDECDRLLKPGGVLALMGYRAPILQSPEHPECNEKIEENIQKFRDACDEKGCWDRRIDVLKRQYVDFELPYQEKKLMRDDPSLFVHKDLNIEELKLFFSTWSGYGELKRRHPDTTALEDLINGIMSIIPNMDQNTKVHIIFPWFLIMCRKPK